jgi:hypothetical protein
VYYATKSYVLSFGRAIGYELRGTGVTVTTLCPGPTTSEFAHVANMQGVALFEGPMPVMTAAEVARQGYAALKAGRPQITTGLLNRIIAMSTRFTPTSILLMIAGHSTLAQAPPRATGERVRPSGDHHGIALRSRRNLPVSVAGVSSASQTAIASRSGRLAALIR